MSLAEDDWPQDYAFDANSEANQVDPMWTSQTQENLVTEQDVNNNCGDAFECDDIEHADVLSTKDMSKSEYSYRAMSNIRNYWAGPSYWKFALNRQSSNTSVQATVRIKHGRRIKKNPDKPNFIDCEDSSSEDDYFIKVRSKAAQKIRNANYRNWSPAKLMLPEKYEISKDLFEYYQFEPSYNILRPRHSEPMMDANENSNHEDYNDDNDDVFVSINFFNGSAVEFDENDAYFIFETANGFWESTSIWKLR